MKVSSYDMTESIWNKRLKELLDNHVCLNCMKCTKKNCDSNKYIKNRVLYKKLTGDNYNN